MPCRMDLLWVSITFVSTLASAQPGPSIQGNTTAQCATKQIALGSFSKTDGVTFLDLKLCGSPGSHTASLIPTRAVPVADSGPAPSYCDKFDATRIVCANRADDATATLIPIAPSSPPVSFPIAITKPVHIEALGGGVIGTAGYSQGAFGVSVLPLDPSLTNPTTGTSITVQPTNATLARGGNADRQDAPHPHQVLNVGAGEVLIPDLGSDVIFQYAATKTGALTWTGQTKVSLGDGPRHGVLGKLGTVYVAMELSLKILELRRGCSEGAEGLARGVCNSKDVGAAVEGAVGIKYDTLAAIRVSQDYRFVYVSLRRKGQEGAVAGYALGENGGLGGFVGVWGSSGVRPRDFNLVAVPGVGEVAVVANVDDPEDGAHNVFVLERDAATGVIGDVLASVAVDKPSCVLPL